MKTRKKTRQFLSMLLTVILLLSSVPTTAFAATIEKWEYPYGDTTAVKVTNPFHGSGEDDGIVNGTDRLNSYAWAMIKRGDDIYIGTNRAFISSEVYGAITRMAPMFGETDIDKLYKIVNYFTYGELPDYTELTDEDCIPEIIKLNPKTGETKILDLPEEFKKIATKAEGCAFRSAVEQNGNLYFGSYGRNYVFLIRVDEHDRATVAFMAGGASTGAAIQYNSLRACGVYEGKQYFGGSSSSLEVWNQDKQKNQYVPLFIAEMEDENYDPNGESTQQVNFDNYIADYRDFKKYADPKDPSVGNEFYDLVAYEGSLYAIISDSDGFAVYKGHPDAGSETANPYGWNWTLVVDGANDTNSPAHGFIAATPYIFQDELYIGSFSSIGGVGATGAQMFMWVKGALEKGDPGRKLSDVMQPLYNLMKKDAKVFRLENDQLEVVKDASEQLEGKCAVYLWRFQEHQNELYMTTFDASILFKYVLDVSLRDILNTYLKSLNEALALADQTEPQGRAKARSAAPKLDSGDEALLESASELAEQLEGFGFSTDDNSEGEEISLTVNQVEKLSESMLALQEAVEEQPEVQEVPEEQPDSEETATLLMAAPPARKNGNVNRKPAMIKKLKTIINSIDRDGLEMVVEMKRQLNANTSGFDLLKTADGETWSFVLDDGFHDKYNFGGRTMVVFDDQLYVGTANPFYGAQLWRIDDGEESETTRVYVYTQFQNTDGEKIALKDVNGAAGLTENDSGWLTLGYVDVAGEVTLDSVQDAIADGKLKHVYNTNLDLSQVKWTDLQPDVWGADGFEDASDSCYHLNGKIPVYTITYTDGVESETVFADQTYQYYMSGAATPDFDGTPSRKGYTFLGWGDNFSNTVNGDAIYTAQWKEGEAPVATDLPTAYTVRCVTEGAGHTAMSISQIAGTASIGAVSKSGDSYVCPITVSTAAYADAYSGEVGKAHTAVHDSISFNMTWNGTRWVAPVATSLPIIDVKCAGTVEGTTYTVTFNANGGSVSPASAITGTDGKLSDLPTPTRSGSYSFDGWYTAVSGGKKVTTSTVFAENSTIYAHWTRTGGGSSGGSHSGGSTSYAITVADAENGSATASRKSASKGTTITVTATPDKGYELDTLKVTDKNGDKVKLTEKNGKYTFTMPASAVTVKATFTKTAENPFTDINDDAYYKDAVIWAVENGITKGTSGTMFSPDAACTRAQAVTFLWRAAGSPAPKATAMPFADVKAGSYYYDAVLWAVENGITKGTSDTTFSPDVKCTRAQIVTFLWRAQKSPAAASVNVFTDVAADAYYADAVNWAVAKGITSGTSAAAFSPNADCTRGQIVTFLYRCLGK